jgi:hypothetical protein
MSSNEIRLLTPGEVKALKDYASYAGLRFEAVRKAEGKRPFVIGILDDPQADVILTFKPGSDADAVSLAEILNSTYRGTLWVEGGITEPDEDEDEEDYPFGIYDEEEDETEEVNGESGA